MLLDRSREDIMWLAGLIEGEGSFLFAKLSNQSAGIRRRGIFCLQMTDLDVVQKARDVWGYGSVKYRSIYGIGTKPSWVWRFESRAQVFALAAAIYPFMGERRKSKLREMLSEMPPVGRPKRYQMRAA